MVRTYNMQGINEHETFHTPKDVRIPQHDQFDDKETAPSRVRPSRDVDMALFVSETHITTSPLWSSLGDNNTEVPPDRTTEQDTTFVMNIFDSLANLRVGDRESVKQSIAVRRSDPFVDAQDTHIRAIHLR